MAEHSAPVLLIEDDPSLVELYQMKFQSHNFKLHTCTDGESGLRTAKSLKPKVILLDVMLPKMDGFDVLTALKADESTKNIPVVILSNMGQKADILKGKQLGAEDFLVKSSLTPSEVFEKIKKYIN